MNASEIVKIFVKREREGKETFFQKGFSPRTFNYNNALTIIG